jgi:23S rRNA G2069 N7-methylase RlmK/C1962 C5-methylase RlmI
VTAKQFPPEQIARHATMLANRVRKRFAHLSRRFSREGVEAFRLYDWDIPEVRAVVDWYAGRLVVAEYERTQTGEDYLPALGRAAGEALGVPAGRVHLKRRRTGVAEGPRYERPGRGGERFEVRERDLRFLVNLSDRLDTGLFPDHRDTRALVRGLAAGADFLNLYAYTGSFTCAAAKGGAASTVTVDRSATYVAWARDNLAANGLLGGRNELVADDAIAFLAGAAEAGARYTLAVVDPPSFSGTRDAPGAFDVNRDHPALLARVLGVMAPGGVVFFSTNHQRFEPRLDGLHARVEELTDRTIPEDYRGRGERHVHRCWRLAL